jgi:hypothetical protein
MVLSSQSVLGLKRLKLIAVPVTSFPAFGFSHFSPGSLGFERIRRAQWFIAASPAEHVRSAE